MNPGSLLKYLLVIALCTACRTVLPETVVIPPGTLVGRWHAAEQHPERGDIDTAFIINADATFSGSLSINSEPVWQYSGTWGLAGNRITWKYLKSNLVLLEVDKAETDEILSVTDETLTYRSVRRGTVNTLQRIQ